MAVGNLLSLLYKFLTKFLTKYGSLTRQIAVFVLAKDLNFITLSLIAYTPPGEPF